MQNSVIRLSSWISPGMVFQHSVPLMLIGYIRPTTSIRLEVLKSPSDGKKVSKLDTEYGLIFSSEVRSDAKGRFSFEFPSQKPSVDMFTFTMVTTDGSIRISDAKCGDVWVIGGSTPVCLPVSQTRAPKIPFKENILDLLRFFRPSTNLSQEISETSTNLWFTVKQSRFLAEISAAGFSFIYHLCDQMRYPIGMVDITHSDSSILEWIDPEKYKKPETATLLQKYLKEGEKIKIRSFKKLSTLQDLNIRGIVYSPNHMDLPLTDIYVKLLSLFLETSAKVLGPKKISGRKDIPSLILLQLGMNYRDTSLNEKVLLFNEMICESRKNLSILTGVLGMHDMLIPEKTNAFYIGRRLSLIALGQHFTPKMPSSCPECSKVEMVGNKVLLTFDNSGDGLKLSEGDSILRGFSICGEDNVYRPAQSKILHGVRVMVWHDDISQPTGVVYGYYPWPSNSRLKSKSDLPVLPFRSDRTCVKYPPDLTFTHCDALETIAVEADGKDPARMPIYEQRKGQVDFHLENLNKTEGSASIKLLYKTIDGYASFAPVLRYASMYAPLDLSKFACVTIDIFNPDERAKWLSVSGFSTEMKIEIGLRWQNIKLIPEKEMILEDFEIRIKDINRNGELYIDNIQFIP